MTDSILRSYYNVSSSTFVPFAFVNNLLLDLYGAAAFAYSLRKLRNAYAGSAVRIRRSSDDAEADIGFNGNDFDAAAAATHIGGGSGFITTWYDQSGNGLDLTQTTSTMQPAYSAAGLGGVPTLSFDGSNDFLSRASVNSLASFGSLSNGASFSVINVTTGDTQSCVFYWTAAGDFGIAPTDGSNTLWDFGSSAGGRVSATGFTLNADHILECYRDSSDDQGVVMDGTVLANATLTPDIPNQTLTFYVGQLSGFGYYLNGFISEIVHGGPDIGSASRTGVRTNMNTYYTVF